MELKYWSNKCPTILRFRHFTAKTKNSSSKAGLELKLFFKSLVYSWINSEILSLLWKDPGRNSQFPGPESQSIISSWESFSFGQKVKQFARTSPQDTLLKWLCLRLAFWRKKTRKFQGRFMMSKTRNSTKYWAPGMRRFRLGSRMIRRSKQSSDWLHSMTALLSSIALHSFRSVSIFSVLTCWASCLQLTADWDPILEPTNMETCS